MPPIQILFVDGPTAAGKDYFIDNFTQAYTKRFPNAKVTKIRSADIVLQGSAKSQDRKYTTYTPPLELVKSIYKGHIELLEYLRVQSDLLSANDLIIVNRSFLSYYIYNFKALLRQCKGHELEATIKELKAYNLNSYSKEYKKALSGISTMFVDLTLPKLSLNKKIKLLVSRVKQRADNMAVMEDWFRYLIVNYDTPRPAFLALFDAKASIESGKYLQLLEDYF